MGASKVCWATAALTLCLLLLHPADCCNSRLTCICWPVAGPVKGPWVAPVQVLRPGGSQSTQALLLCRRCFQSASSDPWNWNVYLFPVWLLGVLVRYGILFPLRSDVLPGVAA